MNIAWKYARITNRTYNQAHPENRYQHNNTGLGFFDKNDFDLIEISLSRWLQPVVSVGLTYSYSRQGEGTPSDDWTEPWLDIEGDYSEPFPSGIVEKTHLLSLSVKGFFMRHLFIDGEAGAASIKNKNNLSSGDKTELFMKITLSGFLSTSLR